MNARRSARAIVLAAVLGAAAFVAAPASSQTDPCAPDEGDTSNIEGTLSTPTVDHVEQEGPGIRVDGSGFRHKDSSLLLNPVQVTRLTAQLVLCGDANGRVLPEPSSASSTAGDNSKYIVWDTPGFEFNGPYAVRLTAEASNGDKRVIVHPFAMDLPATAPTDVKAVVASGSTSVAVGWDTNPEPDVVGYAVEWTAGDASWSEASAETVLPSDGARQTFTHDPGVGTWRYRVTAARQGATADDLNVSDPTTSATVTVTAPATTTTTAAGSGGETTGTSSAAGGGAGSTATSTTAPRATTTANLQRFSQLLDQRRAAIPRPAPTPDPGFQETLPFNPVDEPVVEDTTPEAPQALGSTQEIITDDSERRRAMSFVAAGLFAFVLAFGMRLVKSAADRMPDLEPAAPESEGDADMSAEPVLDAPAPAAAGAATNARGSRRDERRAARSARAATRAAAAGAVPDITTTNPELRDLDLDLTESDLGPERPRARRRRAPAAAVVGEGALDVPESERRRERRARRVPAA